MKKITNNAICSKSLWVLEVCSKLVPKPSGAKNDSPHEKIQEEKQDNLGPVISLCRLLYNIL